MRFASLGSGSRGNALVVQDIESQASLLIDCGLGIRQLMSGLQRLELTLDDIDALFVTHEHSDHARGVASLARKSDMPIYTTHGTAVSAGIESLPNLRIIDGFEPVVLGKLSITPVAVPHDAREPCQFVVSKQLDSGVRKLGVLTDLGSFTPHVVDQYTGCDALVLECNHDLDMLYNGPYPASLRQRVAGDWGHLNNQQAGRLLQLLGVERLQHLVVAHISEKNNTPELALQELASTSINPGIVQVASQDRGFDWLQIR